MTISTEQLNKLAKAKERKAKRAERAKTLWREKPMPIRKHKSYRKRLVKRLDNLFSLIVRGRAIKQGLRDPWDGGKIQCCFHFISRVKYSVRWDFHNAIGASFASNILMEYDAAFTHNVIEWYMNKWGRAQWEDLVSRSNRKTPMSNAELEVLLSEFLAIIEREALKGYV